MYNAAWKFSKDVWVLTAHAHDLERVAVVMHVDANGHLVQFGEMRVLLRDAKLAQQWTWR